MLPVLLLVVRLLHYREGRCCRNFTRWCRRYAACFTAVGAPFTLRRGSMQPEFFAVGVGVVLPILLLLVPPLHYGEVKCCPNFRHWCRRYAAHFTAVGVGVTLPKMFCWYLARMRTFTQLSDGETLSRFVGRIRYYYL